MKRCILFLLLAFPAIAVGQNLFSMGDMAADSSRWVVGTWGSAHVNSTAVTTRFAMNALRGKHLSNSWKNEVSKRLSASNRFGATLDLHMYAAGRIASVLGWKPYKLSWYVRASDRELANARFAPDLFTLSFYGNKSFAGDTAVLDNSQFNTLRYQQLAFGMVNNDGMGHRYGIGVSILNGEQLLQADFYQAQLYTSEIGDEIDASLNGRIIQSDTSNIGFLTGNGLGFSTDLFFEWRTNSTASAANFSLVRLEANDLGFIRWNKQSMRTSVDTSLNFRGIHLSNLDDLQNAVFERAADSLTNRYTPTTSTRNFNTTLPASFRFSLIQQSGKWRTHIGLEARTAANYVPYLFWQQSYQANSWFSVGGLAGYGGYGTVCLGVELQAKCKHFAVRLGSTNLEGAVVSGKTGGLSMYTGIHANF